MTSSKLQAQDFTTMAVRIYLDNPNPVYSNLDIISGKAVLSLNREEAFTAIVVKLECESKTKLASPRSDGRRDYDVELEVHKVGRHHRVFGGY